MTITFGWWLLPALITIVSFFCAHVLSPKFDTRHPVAAFITVAGWLFANTLAAAISLLFWFLWAISR